jgi:hypothetical protein
MQCETCWLQGTNGWMCFKSAWSNVFTLNSNSSQNSNLSSEILDRSVLEFHKANILHLQRVQPLVPRTLPFTLIWHLGSGAFSLQAKAARLLHTLGKTIVNATGWIVVFLCPCRQCCCQGCCQCCCLCCSLCSFLLLFLFCSLCSWHFFHSMVLLVLVSPCRLPPVPQWPPFCGLKMKPLGYSYLQNEILCPQL